METIDIKYKEKLRLAKEALESGSYDKDTIEHIFPELKESEDEIVKRTLIKKFKEWKLSGDEDETWFGLSYDSVIAWLEKQGDTDVVEPRFKVGDYIKHNKENIIYKIISVNSGSYYVENIETGGRIELFNAELKFHLWTIKDAKDGDVIFYDDGWTCIFKHIHGIWFSSYCFITANGEFNMGYERHAVDTEINGNAYPAAKEQRDTLERAMANAGYRWDKVKLKLEKV